MLKKAIFTFIIFFVLLAVGYVCFYYFSMRNVKTPDYRVISEVGSIQTREYAPMLIAEVTVKGEREEAISQGFRLLADYIFGNNISMTAPVVQQGSETIKMTAPVMQQKSEKIAMTAPVTQSGLGQGEWQVRFVMPSNYTLNTLPKPKNPEVKIIAVPAHRAIAITFSGRMTPKNLETHLAKLNAYIEKHQIAVEGEPVYAFYNPPWTLPFMRRNEVMYNLAPSATESQ